MKYNMGINVNSEFSKLWKSDTNLKRNSSKLTNKVKKENAIEIIKKTEKNPQDCYITDKKCANKNIWRIKAPKERKQNGEFLKFWGWDSALFTKV